jgi:sn-glycerol 3-phosphate transport system substrate-binding protein
MKIKQIKNKTQIITLLLATCILFTANAAEITLQFWHSMSGDKSKLVNQMVDAFNEAPEHKGKIRVQQQFVGTYEEGLNKTRTALMANQGPHVVQITDIGTKVMVDTKAVEPLQNFIDKDPSFPSKELLPQLRRYYEINGKLYSLPFASSNPIVFYNVDAFQKAGIKNPPRTFDELTEYSRKLTNKAAKTTGATWPLHSWFFEEYLALQGKTLVGNDNGRKEKATVANFTSPEALAFVELWSNMVKEGIFSNVGRGWDPSEQAFMAGRSAMLITSTSDVYEVVSKSPFKVMTAPLPVKDPKVKGGTIVGGNSLWILKNKPDVEKQAAYEFVKWMASKPMQRLWHVNTGYFPIRSDLIADLEKEGYYAKNPAIKTAITQLRASPDLAATNGALLGVFPELRESVESAIERVLTADEDPKVALARAKDQTEKALARYNGVR